MAAKPKKTETAVKLPAMNIQRISLKLVGDSPLITHAWSEKAKKEMLDKQMQKAKERGSKKAKDPFRDFVESLYWLDGMPADISPGTWQEISAKSRFGIPSTAFKSAIVDAASFLDAFTKVQLRGALHLVGEMVEINSKPPEMREDMVRVGMGTADIRYRGGFTPWSARIDIDHLPSILSTEQVAQLVNYAGFSCGVGEWRPQRDGGYGRFHIE